MNIEIEGFLPDADQRAKVIRISEDYKEKLHALTFSKATGGFEKDERDWRQFERSCAQLAESLQHPSIAKAANAQLRDAAWQWSMKRFKEEHGGMEGCTGVLGSREFDLAGFEAALKRLKSIEKPVHAQPVEVAIKTASIHALRDVWIDATGKKPTVSDTSGFVKLVCLCLGTMSHDAVRDALARKLIL